MRFGRLVSGSWVAWCASWDSNALRSLMSCITPEKNSNRPCSSVWIRSWARTGMTWPWAEMTASSPYHMPSCSMAGRMSVRMRRATSGENLSRKFDPSSPPWAGWPKKVRAAALK
jgi:hypothetical protein